MLRSFVGSLLERGVDLEVEIGSNPLTSPPEIVDHLAGSPERVRLLEDMLPWMELAFGVWILLVLMNTSAEGNFG